MDEPFLGQIMLFAFDFAPRGHQVCQGQLLSISQNTALFALLGTNFGGDGVTTFGLPNLQARVPIGVGNGPGLGSYVVGESGGTENETLTTASMPAHIHTVDMSGYKGTLQCSSAPGDQRDAAGHVLAVESSGTTASYSDGALASTLAGAAIDMGAVGTSPAGNSLGHANMQPSLTINYCIALAGIFPSRN